MFFTRSFVTKNFVIRLSGNPVSGLPLFMRVIRICQKRNKLQGDWVGPMAQEKTNKSKKQEKKEKYGNLFDGN